MKLTYEGRSVGVFRKIVGEFNTIVLVEAVITDFDVAAKIFADVCNPIPLTAIGSKTSGDEKIEIDD